LKVRIMVVLLLASAALLLAGCGSMPKAGTDRTEQNRDYAGSDSGENLPADSGTVPDEATSMEIAADTGLNTFSDPELLEEGSAAVEAGVHEEVRTVEARETIPMEPSAAEPDPHSLTGRLLDLFTDEELYPNTEKQSPGNLGIPQVEAVLSDGTSAEGLKLLTDYRIGNVVSIPSGRDSAGFRWRLALSSRKNGEVRINLPTSERVLFLCRLTIVEGSSDKLVFSNQLDTIFIPDSSNTVEVSFASNTEAIIGIDAIAVPRTLDTAAASLDNSTNPYPWIGEYISKGIYPLDYFSQSIGQQPFAVVHVNGFMSASAAKFSSSAEAGEELEVFRIDQGSNNSSLTGLQPFSFSSRLQNIGPQDRFLFINPAYKPIVSDDLDPYRFFYTLPSAAYRDEETRDLGPGHPAISRTISHTFTGDVYNAHWYELSGQVAEDAISIQGDVFVTTLHYEEGHTEPLPPTLTQIAAPESVKRLLSGRVLDYGYSRAVSDKADHEIVTLIRVVPLLPNETIDYRITINPSGQKEISHDYR
jgi:hypothetical protein